MEMKTLTTTNQKKSSSNDITWWGSILSVHDQYSLRWT